MLSHQGICRKIDKEDVDSLVKTVQANYKSISHRYYRYKVRTLGKKVELLGQKCTISQIKELCGIMKQAKDIVLSAYYEFDQESVILLNLFLKNRGYTRNQEGKTSGDLLPLFSLVTHTY